VLDGRTWRRQLPNRPYRTRFGISTTHTCIDCGRHMNIRGMLPSFWGREYFDDEWYARYEIPHVRAVWSNAIEAAVFSEYRQSLFFKDFYSEHVEPHLTPAQLARLGKRMTSSVEGGFGRMSSARIDQAGIAPDSPPRLRHCIVCSSHFVEPLSASRWQTQVLGGEWDVCDDCLRRAFPANEQHWQAVQKWGPEAGKPPDMRTVRGKKRLAADLRRLTELLGTTPMLHTNMRGLVLSPTWSSERRAEVVRHVKRMAVAETYAQVFGSWFEAMVAAGVLESGAKRVGRGTMVLAEDGDLCRSMAEKIADDWLSSHGIPHEREPPYPKHETLNSLGRKRADWKVGRVYIEYLGLMTDAQYRRRAKEKRQLATALCLDVVVLEPHDLARLDTRLSWALK